MTASALPPDRLRAMADVLAVHVREINRIIASGMHERDALLAAAQACWEASPGGELLEALEPFADAAREIDERGGDDDGTCPSDVPVEDATDVAITVGQLRRAREALRQALPQGTET